MGSLKLTFTRDDLSSQSIPLPSLFKSRVPNFSELCVYEDEDSKVHLTQRQPKLIFREQIQNTIVFYQADPLLYSCFDFPRLKLDVQLFEDSMHCVKSKLSDWMSQRMKSIVRSFFRTESLNNLTQFTDLNPEETQEMIRHSPELRKLGLLRELDAILISQSDDKSFTSKYDSKSPDQVPLNTNISLPNYMKDPLGVLKLFQQQKFDRYFNPSFLDGLKSFFEQNFENALQPLNRRLERLTNHLYKRGTKNKLFDPDRVTIKNRGRILFCCHDSMSFQSEIYLILRIDF